MDALANKTVKGYHLGNLLGTGGFSAVYFAHQEVIDRDVAIKVIWPTFANHPNFVRRFEAEAQLIAGLEHPHIVPLYDYWREPTGAYIVMRLLKGGHLRDEMQVRGAWALADVVPLVNQVATALAHAHNYGIVHRDIKPENILLDEQGNAYLSDFGIAQILSNAQDADDPFMMMGSPAYASPEQLNGNEISPSSDLYSLGIVLYELLAGAHPFPDLEQYSSTQVMAIRTRERLPYLLKKRMDLSPAMDEFLQKATALEPIERYQSATTFMEAFRDAALLSKDRNDANAASDIITLGTGRIPNPYKGLRAFQEADAVNFFGRGSIVTRLLAHLNGQEAKNRFVALIGPSGSGKSSVVKAGLIPAIRRGVLAGSEHWFVGEIVPGTDPFLALESVLLSIATNYPDNLIVRLKTQASGLVDAVNQLLPNDQSELLLFIDQFEELFTLVESEHLITRFLETLRAAIIAPTSRIRVVITLRADFYDRPLSRPEISDLLQESTEVVVPLSPSELEEAIVRPARQSAVLIESDLVGTLIAQVVKQPGALPLLQYTLSELFETRDRNMITLATYHALGGVNGALAKRADELYRRFTPEQQAATRQLFLRLVTLGEGTEDTRRRTFLTEFRAIDQRATPVLEVLEFLGKARLLTIDYDQTTGIPTIEVAHEALLREWSLLRVWLDESREDIRLQRSLSNLTTEWLNAERDASFLLRGTRLEQYRKWNQETSLTLTTIENEFFQTSLSERERLQKDETKRQKRERALERRSIYRLRMLAIVLLMAVVGAFGLSAFALNQGEIAQQAQATSEANAADSQVLALESSAQKALRDHDSDLALLLALAANQVNNSSQNAWQTLAEVTLSSGTYRRLTGHTSQVSDVAFSPDGQWVASSSWDSTIQIWDIVQAQTVTTFTGHTGDVETVDFSPDGQWLISGGADFTGLVWQAQSGEIRHRLVGHTRPIRAAAFSPDGRYITTGAGDRVVILWDATTGQEVRRMEGHTGEVRHLSFSADGRWLLSSAREAILWDMASGELVNTFEAGSNLKVAIISPNGTLVASASTDGTLTLWRVATNSVVDRLIINGNIESLHFDPQQEIIFVGTNDGIIHEWSLATGSEIQRLVGHVGTIFALDVNSQGNQLASASLDGTVRIWRIKTPAKMYEFQAGNVRLTGVAFINDGQQALTSSVDGTLRQWDIHTAEEIGRLVDGTVPVRVFAVSPQQDRLVMGYQNGQLGIHNLITGETKVLVNEGTSTVIAIAINNNGSRAVATTQSGNIMLWNLDDGTLINQFRSSLGTVLSVAFNASDTRILAGTREGTLVLWDVATGATIHRFSGHSRAVSDVAISADGTMAISSSISGEVIVWDMEQQIERYRISEQKTAVWSIAFSPDGEYAVMATADPLLVYWEVASGIIVQTMQPASTPFSVSFSPDGRAVISGQDQGITQVWQVFNEKNLIAWTQANRYLRDFTCAERLTFRLESCK